MTHWTVVSHPGPVEREILDELAPRIVVRRHVGSGITLRALHGEAPRAGAPTLVFLHGRGHAATIWAPVLARLAPHHPIVALDLPGFGHSASRPWSGGDARAGLAFFAEPIGRTIAEVAGDRPILVGHSLGGAVAIATVLAGLVDPRALLLLGCMGLMPRVRAAARLYFVAEPERIARWRKPVRAAVEKTLGRAPERAEALRRELLTVRGGRPDAAAAFRAMVPLLGAPFAFDPAELSSIRQRTVLLWGDRDEAFPLDVATEAARLLPDAEVRVMAAGHAPHLDDPEVVASVVAELAARQDDRSPLQPG